MPAGYFFAPDLMRSPPAHRPEDALTLSAEGAGGELTRLSSPRFVLTGIAIQAGKTWG